MKQGYFKRLELITPMEVCDEGKRKDIRKLLKIIAQNFQ